MALWKSGNTGGAAQTLDPWRYVITLAPAAVMIYLFFALTARTPRGHANDVQAVSSLFLLVTIVRHVKPGGAQESSSREEPSRWGLPLALAIAMGVWVAMIPSYFISDDFAHLYAARQPMLDSLWALLTRGQAGTFLRPLGFASLFLDFRLWHHQAAGYHITSLTIHLIAVAGLFSLCRSLGIETGTAVAAAMIWSVLPVTVEAVAWIGARFDLLSACLVIWSLVFYAGFRNTGRWHLYWGALACFFFAMLSKENAYVLPMLLILVERLRTRRRNFMPVLGFVLLALLMFSYRWLVLGGIGGYPSHKGQPAAYDFGIKTLEGLFIRAPSKLFLGYNWLEPTTGYVTFLAALTGAALISLGLCARSKTIGWKWISFNLGWIFLTILPAHPLLLIDAGMTNSRVLYLGSAAAAILVAQLIACSGSIRIRWPATGLLVALFSLGVLHNLAAWRWTSQLSANFQSEVKQRIPSPPPNAEFRFHNMPLAIRGVFFLQSGLSESLKLAYARDDLDAVRAQTSPAKVEAGSREKTIIEMEWLGGPDRLLAPLR